MLDYGCPKKRKDGMPKKHDPKKKRKERKRGVAMSQKQKREKKGRFKSENQCLKE